MMSIFLRIDTDLTGGGTSAGGFSRVEFIFRKVLRRG